MEVQQGFERMAASITSSVNNLDPDLAKYARDVSNTLFDMHPDVNDTSVLVRNRSAR
jgi:hypothetical protein